MTAVVDPDKCIGCGLCPQICPQVFKMNGDKAIAYTNPVPADLEESCKEAAEGCPVFAIEVS